MKRFASMVRLLSLLSLSSMTTCNAFLAIPTDVSKSKALTNMIHTTLRVGTKVRVTPLTDDNLVSSGSTSTDSKQQRFASGYMNMMTVVVVASYIAGLATTVSSFPQVASASYSAYAHREVDWQQRIDAKSITVTTPKLLRDQLREIAPMNEERSRIFCPNGPSAAVTPLMENRCSDVRQATPSVFGRSDDIVGNSIPGFSKDWTSSSSIYSAADPGGLPEYGFTNSKSNRK